ncbi:hypothetical protein EMUR_01875 [Ehrlichia muris AS145]|uniref:Uncharacterized protein n=1 Tax=Ehrlichia muris AS145 TaxID=1423892 RepID=V9R8S8_9RICK|nr:hypothetical protein EMUR_01875 [Ehrlichia muris AS145]
MLKGFLENNQCSCGILLTALAQYVDDDTVCILCFRIKNMVFSDYYFKNMMQKHQGSIWEISY